MRPALNKGDDMDNKIELNYQRAIAQYREKQSQVMVNTVIEPELTTGRIIAKNTLSEFYLRQHVPSIFSEIHNRSNRYNMIPTMTLVNAMATNGYFPVKANQKRKLDPADRGFARHVIRFRHESRLNVAKDDIIPEIVLLNSHDGTSVYKMMLGIFRCVCSNGLIVAESTMASISVRHTGGEEVIERILNGAKEISAQGNRVFDVINTWKSKPLDIVQQKEFAKGAFDIYRGDKDIKVYLPSLLAPKRDADYSNDLWTTFNVVQERLLIGGFNTQNASGHYRRAMAVKSIDRDICLNKALWDYTVKFNQNLN